MEHALIRLNDTFAPNGIFGIKGSAIADSSHHPTSIGYDAAVCVEVYEPYVLEAHNSSIASPNTMGIVEKASYLSDHTGVKEQLKGPRIIDPMVKRSLNSTGMTPV